MVLADEPTANLDTANGTQAMDIMQKLNKETGAAIDLIRLVQVSSAHDSYGQ